MKFSTYYKYRFVDALGEAALRKRMIQKEAFHVKDTCDGLELMDEDARCGFVAYRDKLTHAHIKVISMEDKAYSSRLLTIEDGPGILFCKGDIDLLNAHKTVAIVGTRKPSKYGLKVAFELARYLARHNIVVVSGLAEGIDTAAHKGALDGGGVTLAVMATGVNRIYPSKNQGLGLEIQNRGGLLISEKPYDEVARRYDFPFRNRLISGLADVTIIIEASHKSGSMITAKYALSQGKTIFALPGNIFSDLHKGTNQLIFDGAIPLIEYKDVLDTLGSVEGWSMGEKTLEIQLDEVEEKIFFYIKKYNIIEIETLSSLVIATPHQISETISKLMLEDLIQYYSLTSVQYIG